ncbi:MAG: glycerol-3-phosphate 1-O-acyltransferase PlsY [Verrucomicrobiota bacterium]|nr:glycerol-3-phosphate 1-O-acyltransferase PlsY [Verrucomicrobiota bacterium]
MTITSVFLVTLIGYLIGSISFASIIARIKGVDIFKEGSGNPGATNVKRVMGAKWGNLVFILDASKGFISAGLPLIIFEGDNRLAVVALIASILGHSFSIFLKFRGGKGVATTMGGLLALMWMVLFIGILIWLLLFFTTKIVALASIIFAVSLPITAYFIYGHQDPRFYLGIILLLVILLRHRANINRIFSGEENTF